MQLCTQASARAVPGIKLQTAAHRTPIKGMFRGLLKDTATLKPDSELLEVKERPLRAQA